MCGSMSAVSNWLHELAVSDFPFSKEDLESDCKELLCKEGREAIDSWEAVENLWKLLQQWQFDKEYLASLDLHIIIARHIRASASNDSNIDNLKEWRDSNLKIDADALADELQKFIREKLKVRTPHNFNNCDQNTKVHYPFELTPVKEFHSGLEHFLGYPALNVDHVEAMKTEHERDGTFVDSRDREINPKVEWNIVVRIGRWNLDGISCEPAHSIERREIGLDYESYMERAAEQYAAAGLNEAEVIALRLWTGPMHWKYVQDLRRQSTCGSITKQIAYANTLHAINSGITKLAQIWKIPRCRKVYRGYKSKSQLNDEIRKDDSGCRGGVERSFLATTEDFDVAVSYSEGGAFILEISVGQINRGADIGWLSQFPHEKEILFNALSNVEVLGNPQMHFVDKKGEIQIYKVEISSNTKSKTLEQYVCLRKDLHLDMTDVLVNQALRMVEQRKQKAKEDLVKELCAECEVHSNAIVGRGEQADATVFNEGTDEYIELVVDVIRFQRQSLFIVDLALQWFKEREACPLDLMDLAKWQHQALKSAFRRCEPPEVTKLVMPNQRIDPSLGWDDRQQAPAKSFFHDWSVDLGEISTQTEALSAGRLVSLNPKLLSLRLNVNDTKADFWEKLFYEFAEHSAHEFCVNNFTLSRYARHSPKRLDFRNQEAREGSMLIAALVYYPPIALADLRVQNCPIGCDGAQTLGQALSNLQNLVSLSLSECKVSDRGCTEIAKALTKLSMLTFLDLSRNEIGNLGALNLAQVLSSLRALKIMDLNHNIVGNQGASALAGVANPNLLYNNLKQLELVDIRFNEAHLRPFELGHSFRLTTNISSEFCCDHAVKCVAWSPERSKIAAGSLDGIVFIFDAVTGQQKTQLKCNTHVEFGNPWDACTSEVLSVAWSPESSKIVSGSGYRYFEPDVFENVSHSKYLEAPGEIIVWNAEDGSRLAKLEGHTDAITSVAWSPEGSELASGSDDWTIIIWDAVSEEKNQLEGHVCSIRSVAWSPDGVKIASGAGNREYPGEVIIWDTTTGEQIYHLKDTFQVSSVAWSPDGSKIASACDNSIIIWAAASGEQKFRLKGHTDSVGSVAWSPDCSKIASASDDKRVIIWDAETREQKSRLKGHIGTVLSVAWSPEGNKLASGSEDNTIIIWDAVTGEHKTQLQVRSYGRRTCVDSVAWSPKGDKLAAGVHRDDEDIPGSVIIWDAQTGEQKIEIEAGRMVFSVAWSPDSDKIASSGERSVIIRDAETGELKTELEANPEYDNFRSVAWSTEGSKIASGSYHKTIIIWDAVTGEQKSQLKGHTAAVKSVAWSPDDSKIVSGGGEHRKFGEIIIWDATTGQQKIQLKGHSDEVHSVAWSPEGSKIASGSADNSVIIWDAVTEEQKAQLKGHTRAIYSVAWSPEGFKIASGSDDHTIIIWDAEMGHKHCQMEGHTSIVTSVAWSPEGDELASGSLDNAADSEGKRGSGRWDEDDISTDKGGRFVASKRRKVADSEIPTDDMSKTQLAGQAKR